MRNPRLLTLAFIFGTLVLVSCGGGGGGGSTPPPTSDPLTVTTATLSAAYNGEDYSAQLFASGGKAPYTWSVSNGTLPAGLSLNAGVISGQPTQDGTSTFTLQVRDSAARVASKDFSMTISTRFHFVTKSLPNGVMKQPYSATVTTAGGTGTVSMTTNALIGNLQFNNGVFSGAPQYPGIVDIIVQATDSATPPVVITKTFTVDFLGILGTYLYDGQQGVPYNFTLNPYGGTDPLQWSLLNGSLPTGLTFQHALPGSGFRSNTISGTPIQIGTFPFTLRIVDSSNPSRTYDVALSIRVIPAPLAISTTQLNRGEIGVPYSATLQARGGVPPYSWSTTYINQLPAGLALSASGQITGTPTTQLRTDIWFQVRDSLNVTTTSTITMLVTPPLPPRNDSIANATPFPLGSSKASISPYGDPNGTSNPDVDYYKIVAHGGDAISVSAGARGVNFNPPGMQPGIEIIDANGFRYSTCNDPANDNQPAGSPIPTDPTPNGFDDQCMNLAYLNSNTQVASLLFLVPGSGTVTFYVRVFDYRGDARPDFLYDFSVYN